MDSLQVPFHPLVSLLLCLGVPKSENPQVASNTTEEETTEQLLML